MRWHSPYFWEVLYSPRAGLFTWTPLAYLGTLGLLAARPGTRITAAALAVGYAIQLWINGAAFNWWFDWSFGARRLTDVTIVLVLGVGFVIERLRALHARHPRLAPHLALGLALGPLVLFNLESASSVVSGKQKVNVNIPTLELYAASFKRIADAIEAKVGNPFSWPANLVWAVRHRVSPARWDELAEPGKLLFDPRFLVQPPFRTVDTIDMTADALRKYGAGPWAREEGAVPPRAWAGAGARLLVPLHIDEAQHWVVRGVPAAPGRAVTVVVNGRRRDVFEPGAGPQELRLDFHAGELHEGTNELAFDCAPPVAGTLGCFGVEALDLVYESSAR